MADAEGDCVPMDTSCADAPDPAPLAQKSLTAEVKSEIEAAAQKSLPNEVKLTSERLGNLIMEKLAGAFACNGEIHLTKLKDRILEINQSKDRVSQKLITMQKQLEEVAKAVVENSEYAANPTDVPPAPLKFYRSVGLQVNTESRAQLSLQNSSNLRTKENTVPFKRNGVLVGPASVKRNYANKMGETGQDAVPNKRPSAAGRSEVADDGSKMDTASASNSNGSTSGVQIVNLGNGQSRSVILQSAQGAPNPGGVVLRPPLAATRAVSPRAGTAIRSATPTGRAAPSNRFQVGAQQIRKFALPPMPPPSNNNIIQRQDGKELPPPPVLTLKSQPDGIVLSWTHKTLPNHAEIINYQIFACQESLTSTRAPIQWKRVGDVKALPLPMACTLSQFTDENRYHFIVRGVDINNRTGPFCESMSIIKKKN